uniref:Uncharacterized protein n=1 Tax=Cucumis melo TaxID=3656 RepID=A0A9I9EIA7_CUCME
TPSIQNLFRRHISLYLSFTPTPSPSSNRRTTSARRRNPATPCSFLSCVSHDALQSRRDSPTPFSRCRVAQLTER